MYENSQQSSPGSRRAAWIGLFVGPLLLLACLLSEPPSGLSVAGWHTVGLALLLAAWWATEAIPIPATSLLPILLIPTAVLRAERVRRLAPRFPRTSRSSRRPIPASRL